MSQLKLYFCSCWKVEVDVEFRGQKEFLVHISENMYFFTVNMVFYKPFHYLSIMKGAPSFRGFGQVTLKSISLQSARLIIRRLSVRLFTVGVVLFQDNISSLLSSSSTQEN